MENPPSYVADILNALEEQTAVINEMRAQLATTAASQATKEGHIDEVQAQAEHINKHVAEQVETIEQGLAERFDQQITTLRSKIRQVVAT